MKEPPWIWFLLTLFTVFYQVNQGLRGWWFSFSGRYNLNIAPHNNITPQVISHPPFVAVPSASMPACPPSWRHRQPSWPEWAQSQLPASISAWTGETLGLGSNSHPCAPYWKKKMLYSFFRKLLQGSLLLGEGLKATSTKYFCEPTANGFWKEAYFTNGSARSEYTKYLYDEATKHIPSFGKGLWSIQKVNYRFTYYPIGFLTQ